MVDAAAASLINGFCCSCLIDSLMVVAAAA
jgi:hypothetical protein